LSPRCCNSEALLAGLTARTLARPDGYALGDRPQHRHFTRSVHRHGAALVLSHVEIAEAANLYVANNGPYTVTAYGPGKTSVLRTISQGVSGPDALAFGS
jgi:hypothetical protein